MRTDIKYYLHLEKHDNGQYGFKIIDDLSNLLHYSSSSDLASILTTIHNYNYSYELIKGEAAILQDIFALVATMNNTKDCWTKYAPKGKDAYLNYDAPIDYL
jgi:hypothetical protein